MIVQGDDVDRRRDEVVKMFFKVQQFRSGYKEELKCRKDEEAEEKKSKDKNDKKEKKDKKPSFLTLRDKQIHLIVDRVTLPKPKQKQP